MFANTAALRGQGMGYNLMTMPEGQKVECDTFQCAHCNTTVFVDPKTPSPWCSWCDKQRCFKPECRDCRPFMKMIEKAEAEARARALPFKACDNV